MSLESSSSPRAWFSIVVAPESKLMEEFYRIRRLPPYVFEQVNRAKAAARNAGADIIDLGMGNPDLPTPPHVIEKLKETLGKPRTDRYSASKGINGLRRAQAGYYARRTGDPGVVPDAGITARRYQDHSDHRVPPLRAHGAVARGRFGRRGAGDLLPLGPRHQPAGRSRRAHRRRVRRRTSGSRLSASDRVRRS